MNEFGPYITAVLKGTYLSKGEKRAWREEILNHLVESYESAIKAGMPADEAYTRVLTSFGRAPEVRRRVIRETYGISPNWFVGAMVASIVALILTFFVDMRVNDFNPLTLTPLMTPRWVSFFHTHFPSSPAVWAGVAVLCCMLLYTRRQKDRVFVFVAMAPFVVAWLLERMFNHAIPFREIVVSTSSLAMIQPFGAPEIVGYILTLVMCLAIYAWTNNRMVGVTPWVIGIAITIVPVMCYIVQTSLWYLTSNPIFWGTKYPDLYHASWLLLVLAARAIVLVLYMYGCRKINAISLRKSTIA